jgi:hypothetical protein
MRLSIVIPTLGTHLIITAVLLTVSVAVLPASAAECESLSHLALPNTTVTVAQSVPAGTFITAYGDSIDKLPAFCRVAGVIKPTSDSYIRFEVWLPAAGWNERYLGVGNGGFAGFIEFGTMVRYLKRGYATGSTDTGHEGDEMDASWAFRHPEKVNDFGWRALHLTTTNAKSIIHTFYSRPSQHSYFEGCSDGGREALMEAQRFPEDFDGIIAGAPASSWTRDMASGLYVIQKLMDPAAYISNVKIPAISAAALAACDARDGLKDGIISNLLQCHFDPSVLLCQDVDSRKCLTAPQVAFLKTFYAGMRNSRGQQIFWGQMPGGEDGPGGWREWFMGLGPGAGASMGFRENYFRYMVFEDPKWNLLTADPEMALRMAEEKTGRALDAIDPDLRRFQARGGKLILYHGWSDPAIPPLNTVNYYESVLAALGAQTAQSFIRLYMVPGMQHCIDGPGANLFGQFGIDGGKHGMDVALEQWLEEGKPPEGLVATKYVGDNLDKGAQMTRPLCPYPQIPKYKGSGDSNDAANFVCATATN